MKNIKSALAIGSQIRGLIGARASSLIAVPEIQRDSPEDAVHKLQVQVIALSDAMLALAAAVEELQAEAHGHRR